MPGADEGEFSLIEFDSAADSFEVRRRGSGSAASGAAPPHEDDPEEAERAARLDALAVEVYLSVEDDDGAPAAAESTPARSPRSRRAWVAAYVCLAAFGTTSLALGADTASEACEEPLATWAMVFGLLVLATTFNSARRFAAAEKLRQRPAIEQADDRARRHDDGSETVVDLGEDQGSEGSISGAVCRSALWLFAFVWALVGMYWLSRIEDVRTEEGLALRCPPRLFSFCFWVLLTLSSAVGVLVLWVLVQLVRDCQRPPRGVHTRPGPYVRPSPSPSSSSSPADSRREEGDDEEEEGEEESKL